MQVAVANTRHDHPPAKRYGFGRRPAIGKGASVITDINDFAITDSHGLDPGLRRIDGVDFAVMQNPVCRRRGRRSLQEQEGAKG